jgi:hypothetical protein
VCGREAELNHAFDSVHGAAMDSFKGPLHQLLVSDYSKIQVWGAWGVQNGPSTVYEPDAPPRVTEAKTGGAALGPIVLSLLFLLAVERMLEPLLLPLDKDGPTEDLVCVVRIVV